MTHEPDPTTDDAGREENSAEPTPGAAAPTVDGPLDPEDVASTYVLEPEDLTHLLRQLVVSPGAAENLVRSPQTGAPLVSVPVSTADDVARAVGEARAAQRAWARRSVADRARVLLALGDIVLDEQSDVLDLVQLENGKSRASAFEEVADLAQVTRHYGVRGASYLRDRRVPGMLPVLTSARVHRRPVGVVGVIAPWNYPLTLALSDALPALLAGNAVVLKPDPQTTLTALWAAEALLRAGLPRGVLRVVAGGGEVGAALVDAVDHVVFTGSTATGRKVAAQAAGRLVGTTLELGGKNPLYVAADADVDAAALGAVRACFGNTGQLCMSIERLYVHADVADAFTAAFVARVRELRVGPGLDYTHDVGSLTTSAQLERLTQHVDDALSRGARVLVGGVHRTDLGPLFHEPTVLTDVPGDALCAREETFGPLVTLRVVEDDDEAVRLMNDTEYGLNASIWTTSARRGRELAARVEAGSVGINDGYASAWGSVAAPMGGFKQSGLGRRHGRESIEAMTEPQTIVVQRLVGHGASLDELFKLPDGKGQALLTTGLRALRALRMP